MGDFRTLALLLIEDVFEDGQAVREALLEIDESGQWGNRRSSSVEHGDCVADAERWLRRCSFDAILLNLSLPDSPTLLDSFVTVSALAASVPIIVLADESDEHFANRLLRGGAQDVLVKSELECAPLARAIRYAIERQRRLRALDASALFDDLTGLLTRRAFSTFAAHCRRGDLLAAVEIVSQADALDPLLIQTAELLRTAFGPSVIIGRWDQFRIGVITSAFSEAAVEAILRRAAADIDSLQFSVGQLASSENMEEILGGHLRSAAETAILAD